MLLFKGSVPRRADHPRVYIKRYDDHVQLCKWGKIPESTSRRRFLLTSCCGTLPPHYNPADISSTSSIGVYSHSAFSSLSPGYYFWVWLSISAVMGSAKRRLRHIFRSLVSVVEFIKHCNFVDKSPNRYPRAGISLTYLQAGWRCAY